jgi:hypothetical protein
MEINRFDLFLKQNISLVKNEILPVLGYDFTTLDFIKKIIKRFEGNHVNYTYLFREDGLFGTVHSQVEKFLAENESFLNITRSRKVKCEDAYGLIDVIEVWEKENSVYNECYY